MGKMEIPHSGIRKASMVAGLGSYKSHRLPVWSVSLIRHAFHSARSRGDLRKSNETDRRTADRNLVCVIRLARRFVRRTASPEQ